MCISFSCYQFTTRTVFVHYFYTTCSKSWLGAETIYWKKKTKPDIKGPEYSWKIWIVPDYYNNRFIILNIEYNSRFVQHLYFGRPCWLYPKSCHTHTPTIVFCSIFFISLHWIKMLLWEICVCYEATNTKMYGSMFVFEAWISKMSNEHMVVRAREKIE